MIKWAEQYIAISRKSFIVLLGDPFVILLGIFYLGVTLLIAGLPGFTFGEQVQMLRDQALAMAFIGGCFAATLGASHLITDDINNMIPLIMTRPVFSSALIFGKWTGIIGMLAVITGIAAISCLWGTRIIYYQDMIETLGVVIYSLTVVTCLLFMALRHYFFRGAFIWQTNMAILFSMSLSFALLNFWGYNGKLPCDYGILVRWDTLYAYLFIFLALAVFSAIVCFFSVFCKQSLLMVVGIIIFFTGLFARYFIGKITVPDIQRFLYVFIPDWQNYWIVDIINKDFSVSSMMVLYCLINSLIQSAIFLIAGVWVFGRKEFVGKF